MASDEDFDLSSLGLDIDFSFEDDFGDLSLDMKDDRKPIEAFKASATKEIKNSLKSPVFWKKVMASALSPGYKLAFNAYDDVESSVKAIYGDNRDSVESIASSVVGSADKLGKSNLIPKWLRKYTEDNSRSESESSYSEYKVDELSEISKIFANVKLEDEKYKLTQDARSELISKKATKAQLAGLDTVARGIGRLVGYQDNILSKYHQKSLEISFRGLELQTKLLATTSEYHETSLQALTVIAKNSSLPDILKQRNSEMMKYTMRQRLIDSAIETTGNFTRNYFSGVRKQVGGVLSGLSSYMGIANSTLGGTGSFQSKGQMAGDFLGSGLGKLLPLIVGGAVGTKSKEINKYLSDNVKGYSGLNDLLSKYLTNVPQGLNEWSKSPTKDPMTLRGMFVERLKGLFDQHSMNSTLSGDSIINLDSAKSWDNQSHKTLNEIIPAYLSSMDRSLFKLATGDDRGAMEWSHYSGGMVSSEKLKQQHVNIALKDGTADSVRYSVDELLRKMGADDLSLEAKRQLRRRLVYDMSSVNDFKPERYIKPNTWSDLPPEISSELIDFFHERFDLGVDGKPTGSAPRSELGIDEIRSDFASVAATIPNLVGRMEALKSVTGRRIWRDLGLTKFDGVSDDVVDQMALIDILVGGKDEIDSSLYEKSDHGVQGTNLKDKLVGAFVAANAEQLEEQARQERIRMSQMDSDVDFNTSLTGSPEFFNNVGKEIANNVKVEIPEFQFPQLQATSDSETHRLLGLQHETTKASQMILSEILVSVMKAASTNPDPNIRRQDEMRRHSRLRDLGRWLRGSSTGEDGERRSVMSKLFAPVGWFGNYLRFSYGGMGKLASAATTPIKWTKDLIVGSRERGSDILNRAGEVVIKAKDLELGKYRDKATGKIITKYEDIKGALIDKDNNEILSDVEFKAGIFKKTAGDFVHSVGSALGNMTKMSFKPMGMIKSTIEFAGRKLWDDVSKKDAYFPGEKEPRLRANLLKQGFYRLADGTVLKNYKDIVGDIFDINGNKVITKEELDENPEMVTISGSTLFKVANLGVSTATTVLDKAVGATTWYFGKAAKAYKWMGKKLWNVAKSPFVALGRGIGRLFGFGKNKYKVPDVNSLISEDNSPYQNNMLMLTGNLVTSNFGLLSTVNEGFMMLAPETVRSESWTETLKRRGKKGKDSKGGDISDVTIAIEDFHDDFLDSMEDILGAMDGGGGFLDSAMDMLGGRGGRRGRRGRRGSRRSRRPGGRLRGGFLRNAARAVAGSSIVKAVASKGAMAGHALRTAAMAGASAIGVTGAVAIGSVLVIGGVSYAIYKGYQSRQAKKLPINYLRMTQYGVDAREESQVLQMAGLEEYFKKFTRRGENNEPIVDMDKMDMGEVIKLFSVGDDEKRITRLANWLVNRFLPTYKDHVKALWTLTNGNNFNDADNVVLRTKLSEYVDLVKRDDMKDIYNNRGELSPYSGKVWANAKDVTKAIENALGYVKKQEELTNTKSLDGYRNASDKNIIDHMKADTELQVGLDGTSSFKDIESGIVKNDGFFGNLSKANKYEKGTNSLAKRLDKLDIPTAVRFMLYGLPKLNMFKVEKYAALDDLLFDNVRYDGSGNVVVNIDDTTLINKLTTIFHITSESQERRMLSWYKYRVRPVFDNWCNSFRAISSGDPRRVNSVLTAKKLVGFLENVTGTMVESEDGQMIPIWQISASPWNDENSSTDPKPVMDLISQIVLVDDGLSTVEGAIQRTKERSEIAARGGFDKDLSPAAVVDAQITGKTAGLPVGVLAPTGFENMGVVEFGGVNIMDGVGITGGMSNISGTHVPLVLNEGEIAVRSGGANYKRQPGPGLDKGMQLAYEAAMRNGITDPTELAMFLGTLDEETGSFKSVEENLRYSPERMAAVWPGRFRNNMALARKLSAAGPEAIANAIYGTNKGLGNKEPGDGWKYRGRGFIQLTGRYNYEKMAKLLGIDLVNNPDLLLDPTVGAEAAAKFWTMWNPKLPKLARAGDIVGVTKIVNGGSTNLANRRNLYNKYQKMIAGGQVGKWEAAAKANAASGDPVAAAAAANSEQIGPIAADPAAQANTAAMGPAGNVPTAAAVEPSPEQILPTDTSEEVSPAISAAPTTAAAAGAAAAAATAGVLASGSDGGYQVGAGPMRMSAAGTMATAAPVVAAVTSAPSKAAQIKEKVSEKELISNSEKGLGIQEQQLVTLGEIRDVLMDIRASFGTAPTTHTPMKRPGLDPKRNNN